MAYHKWLAVGVEINLQGTAAYPVNNDLVDYHVLPVMYCAT